MPLSPATPPPPSTPSSPNPLAPLAAALLEALLRLVLRLSGISEAVWARATAATGGSGVCGASGGGTADAPRLALSLNNSLAALSRSCALVLGVPLLKPSLREIATIVRAVEIEGRPASAPSSSSLELLVPFPPPPPLSRAQADAALLLCLRHSLPAFLRAFWRQYAVAAATGALVLGLLRDVVLPLVLWAVFGSTGAGATAAAAITRLFSSWPLGGPFVAGPLWGVAIACGAQMHGDPLWAPGVVFAWVSDLAASVWASVSSASSASAAAAAAAAADPAAAAAAATTTTTPQGWCDGGADIDMVDELLHEAGAYLDAMDLAAQGEPGLAAGAGADAAAGSGSSGGTVAAADLGARVLRALRHRRVAAGTSSAE
jgi:hypothetical protein